MHEKKAKPEIKTDVEAAPRKTERITTDAQ